jgi:hypothetical protein
VQSLLFLRAIYCVLGMAKALEAIVMISSCKRFLKPPCPCLRVNSLSASSRLLPPPPTETRLLDCETRPSGSSQGTSHTRMAFKCHAVNKVEGTNLQGYMYGESSVSLNAKVHAWRQRIRPISQFMTWIFCAISMFQRITIRDATRLDVACAPWRRKESVA